MDCSPAGMFLSRPGACSDPTSFFNAENIFLLDVQAVHGPRAQRQQW